MNKDPQFAEENFVGTLTIIDSLFWIFLEDKMNLQISVMHGYVANTANEVDVIAIPISSRRNVNGGENQALIRKADMYFHNGLKEEDERNGLVDGKVYPIFGNKLKPPWNFRDVLFMIDDMKEPLQDLVYLTLATARGIECKSIAIPAGFRMGLRYRGRVENEVMVANDFSRGIGKFARQNVYMKVLIYVSDEYPDLYQRLKGIYSR